MSLDLTSRLTTPECTRAPKKCAAHLRLSRVSDGSSVWGVHGGVCCCATKSGIRHLRKPGVVTTHSQSTSLVKLLPPRRRNQCKPS